MSRALLLLAVLALGCSGSVSEGGEPDPTAADAAPLDCSIVVMTPDEPRVCGTGPVAELRCSRPITDMMTARCRNTLTADGTAPCVVALGEPVTRCWAPDGSDGTEWCCTP